ncbi:MAG: ATP-dependent Clp protease ATP-binding subunit, partial [Lachnospiraceae bacterium]|nr:ATP-dependent Clp protease ATP-binding subunit [Lachnospiraceae bacterium]
MDYTKKAEKVLEIAAKRAKSLHQNYVGTEHILLGLIEEGTGVAAKVLAENGVGEQQLLEMIEELIATRNHLKLEERDGYTPRAQDVLEESSRQAARFGSAEIGTEHILMALIRDGDNIAVRLLNTLGVQLQKVYVELLASMGEDPNLYREDLGRKKKGDGTKTLEQYSTDVTKKAENGELDPVIGRNEEISRVIQIVSRRTKNNPCLIGEPGVGKTAIVEGLAQRIVAGNVPDTVKNKRVVTLDLSGMVAGSKYRGEFEERIKKVIKEVITAGNILLFVDEIHTIIGAGGAEGAIDASNILKPSLSR